MKSEYYTEHYKQQRAERKTYIFPLKKGFDVPPGKSFGDYEIYLVKKEDQQFWSWECEIAHKMTLHQIRKKTSPHVWFCNNQKISDLIKIGLNKNAVILSDIHQPSMISKMLRDNFYAKNISSEAQKNLLEKIELLGGIISCKLLASLGLKKDTYYRAKLEDLYQQGHLLKASSCLVPGVSRGNNENYYSLGTIDICSNFNELTKGVIRSHLVRAVLSQGFKYNNYHSDFDAFSFTKDKINYLFLVDYTFETVEQNIVRLNKALKHISWARIGIACNDYNRAKSFFEGKKNILVWTLYKLKQAKSYRYRNEAK